jgi:choline dehydrogenase
MPVLAETEEYPHQPLVDWDLVASTNVDNRRIHYAQGKTLGGSSAINTMAYHRATRGAYQRWADVVGDESYAFDEILPFFKMSSTLTPPDLRKRNAPNATVRYDAGAFDNKFEGSLEVSWSNWVDPAQSWLVRALQGVGMNMSVEGFSSEKLEGGAWVPMTIYPKNSTRSTSKSAYLDELVKEGKAMPTVYLRSHASKVLFDKNKTATGVAVTTANRDYVLTARKEVILSAGVFHSPQLLMFSGTITTTPF